MREASTWMPLYIGDYLADTTHLTTAEHGAYLLLIMVYWRSGKALPDDNVTLARYCRATPRLWKILRSRVSPFFQIGDGVWRHKRIEAEMSEARHKSEIARGNALSRYKDKTPDLRTQDSGSAAALPPLCSSPSPSPIKTGEVREVERGAPAKNSRGAKLTADWGLSADLLAWTIGALREHGMDIPTAEAWKDRILPKFRDYWTGKAGAAARKTDWDATWRNWLRRELETIPRMNGNHNGPTEQAETDRRAKLVAGAVARTTRPLAGGLAPLPAGNADTFLPAFSGRNGGGDA